MSDSKALPWYSTEPSVGDTVMFTTTNVTNEYGYEVLLDEYCNQKAFLPFSELSAKKIKKNPASFLKTGSKHCANVMDAGNAIHHVSLKDVTKDQKKEHSELYGHNSKLFGLCLRLSHFKFTESEWHIAFRDAMESSATHPYLVITNRFTLRDQPDFMPKEFADVILNNHATLFGMKPFSLDKRIMLVTFDPNGNQVTKDELARIVTELKEDDSDHSDEHLYKNQVCFNLSVQPIALPTFKFTISAYLDTLCEEVYEKLLAKLKQSRFDIVNPVN